MHVGARDGELGALYPLASQHSPETMAERWGILYCHRPETLLQDYSLRSWALNRLGNLALPLPPSSTRLVVPFQQASLLIEVTEVARS